MGLEKKSKKRKKRQFRFPKLSGTYYPELQDLLFPPTFEQLGRRELHLGANTGGSYSIKQKGAE